ncbi:hypothetical protein [Mesobacillus persicus]|uniref:hypothetical protein n=1 Tax=Mesobacillus persicus TaxID=930146 RepID=UPI000B877ED6|nr:hypothetical protein [Mesobacillus persicus]
MDIRPRLIFTNCCLERKALDSCGSSGTGETPQERERRGGSAHAPRKASAWSGKQLTRLTSLIQKGSPI